MFTKWYESMCEDMNGDVRQIAQELDVSFVGSGGNVIDEKYIEYQSQNNVIDPEFTAELENITSQHIQVLVGPTLNASHQTLQQHTNGSRVMGLVGVICQIWAATQAPTQTLSLSQG